MQNLNLYEGRAKSSVTNRLPWFLSQVYFKTEHGSRSFTFIFSNNKSCQRTALLACIYHHVKYEQNPSYGLENRRS